MKTSLPYLKTGIIVPNTHGHPHIEDNWFKFDYVLPRLDVLTPELVTRAHDSGKQILPWTVNPRGDLKKAIIMGVDGIITNDPCKALHTMKNTGFRISM